MKWKKKNLNNAHARCKSCHNKRSFEFSWAFYDHWIPSSNKKSYCSFCAVLDNIKLSHKKTSVPNKLQLNTTTIKEITPHLFYQSQSRGWVSVQIVRTSKYLGNKFDWSAKIDTLYRKVVHSMMREPFKISANSSRCFNSLSWPASSHNGVVWGDTMRQTIGQDWWGRHTCWHQWRTTAIRN